jgi:hypothetical protein
METIKIDIVNAKAFEMLRSLVDQELIVMREPKSEYIQKVLKDLRSKSDVAPDLDTITAEVEKIRARRQSLK